MCGMVANLLSAVSTFSFAPLHPLLCIAALLWLVQICGKGLSIDKCQFWIAGMVTESLGTLAEHQRHALWDACISTTACISTIAQAADSSSGTS